LTFLGLFFFFFFVSVFVVLLFVVCRMGRDCYLSDCVLYLAISLPRRLLRAARKCELISRSAVHQSRSRVVRLCLHSFISIAAFTILFQAHSQTFFSAVSALRKASYGTQQSMTWPVKMATITTPIRKLGDNIKLLTRKPDAVWPLNNI
jgi:hypothetical protein